MHSKNINNSDNKVGLLTQQIKYIQSFIILTHISFLKNGLKCEVYNFTTFLSKHHFCNMLVDNVMYYILYIVLITVFNELHSFVFCNNGLILTSTGNSSLVCFCYY